MYESYIYVIQKKYLGNVDIVPDIVSICKKCNVEASIFDSDKLIVNGVNSFYTEEHNRYHIYLRSNLNICFHAFIFMK